MSTITQTFTLANNGIKSLPLTGGALGLSIAQNINNILTTILGQDRARPDFGSRLIDCIDKPLQQARLCVVKTIYEAVARWEKRIKLNRVDVVSTDLNSLTITLTYEILA